MTAPYQPGDKLRVTVDQPYGSALAQGDLVTVTSTGVASEPGRGAIPVVYVSTAHGPQILGVDAVEPWSPPTYVPAEPDDVTDAQLRAMAAADPELGTWATDADTALGATDEDLSEQLADDHPTGIETRREVGEPLGVTDGDGDRLAITYLEEDHPTDGRVGMFILRINDGDAVLIPAKVIDPVIRYLFSRRNHSRRPEE